MNEYLNTKFVFKNKEFEICLQSKDCENLPQSVLLSLLTRHQYVIQSNASDNVFQSFINYFNNRDLPEIKNENIEEFDQLSKEFPILAISNLVQQRRNFFNEINSDIKKLNSDSITDKTDIEHRISQKLDDYIQICGDELISAPIQSLFNILSNIDRNFTSHNRLYELIQSQFQKTKNSKIFLLLQFVDGTKITQKNLMDSFMHESERFGYRPSFDIASLISRIQELEKENEKLKNQNDNQKSELNDRENNNKRENFIQNKNEKINSQKGKSNIQQEKVNSQNNQQKEQKNQEKHEYSDINQQDKINDKQEQMNFDNNQQEQVNNQIVLDGKLNNDIEMNSQQEKISNQQEKIDDNIHEKTNNENNLNENSSDQNSQHEESNSQEDLYEKIGNYKQRLLEIYNEIKSMNKNETIITISSDEVSSNGINYKLDKSNHTAEITFPPTEFEKVFVPRTIQFQSEEYIIIGIGQLSSTNPNLKSIYFSDDCEIKCIDFYKLNCENLEIISIPSRVEKVIFANDEYNKLTNFLISYSNPRFQWYENNFLLGKSNKNMNYFDILIFARRNIEHAKIPSNVKHIYPYSFYKCLNLQTIEISPDSKLSSIGSYAFYSTSIETIKIPHQVGMIGNFAFFSCNKLHHVDFPINSELRSIGNYAFYSTPIKTLFVPQNVKTIGDYAFASCSKLQSVDYSTNAKVRTIGFSAFYSSPITTIEIPLNVRKLADGWANGLYNLTSMKVLPENKRFLWFDDSFLLWKSDKNTDVFDVLIFARKNIEHAKIPSSIKDIRSYSFFGCKNLQSVEFTFNSNLSSIGDSAFESTSIEEIKIPSHVTSIGSQAFSSCSKLEKVTFMENSELCSIGEKAFFSTSIEMICIPSAVESIGDYAFSSCGRLQSFVFPEDSKLGSIGDSTFDFPFIKTIKFPPHYQIIT